MISWHCYLFFCLKMLYLFFVKGFGWCYYLVFLIVFHYWVKSKKNRKYSTSYVMFFKFLLCILGISLNIGSRDDEKKISKTKLKKTVSRVLLPGNNVDLLFLVLCCNVPSSRICFVCLRLFFWFCWRFYDIQYIIIFWWLYLWDVVLKDIYCHSYTYLSRCRVIHKLPKHNQLSNLVTILFIIYFIVV